METPLGPEITALAAWGREPLCDYVLRGRSKKAVAWRVPAFTGHTLAISTGKLPESGGSAHPAAARLPLGSVQRVASSGMVPSPLHPDGLLSPVRYVTSGLPNVQMPECLTLASKDALGRKDCSLLTTGLPPPHCR